MAVIDELVTMLRYEIAAGTEASIERFQKGLAGADSKAGTLGQSLDRTERSERAIDKTTRMLNTSWEKTTKGIDTAKKAAGGLATGFKTLGAVSMVTSGLMAAWGINAAKGASQINKMGYSLQLSTDQVQEMGSVYKQFGSSMETFAQDAARWKQLTNQSFDASAVKEIYGYIKDLSDLEATNWADAHGFSHDTVRIIRETNGEFGPFIEKARQLSHITSPEQLKNLTALNKQWGITSETISGLSAAFQSDIAPGLIVALQSLTTLASGAARNIVNLENAISNFNGKKISENIQSDDADVRQKTLDEAKRDLNLQGIAARVSGSTGFGEKNAETRKRLADAEAQYHNLLDTHAEKTLGADVYKEINDDLRQGKHQFPERIRTENPTMNDLALAELSGGFDNSSFERDYRNFDETGRLNAEAFDRRFTQNKEHENPTQFHTSPKRPTLTPQRIRADEIFGALGMDEKGPIDVSAEMIDPKSTQEFRNETITNNIDKSSHTIEERSIDRVASERMPTPPATVRNETITNNFDNSLHTTEQSPADAAAATVSEFSEEDFLPESEMDKKHFQPEQVAEMVREKSEPIPPSMLFGNASPNVKVDMSSMMPAAVPQFYESMLAKLNSQGATGSGNDRGGGDGVHVENMYNTFTVQGGNPYEVANAVNEAIASSRYKEASTNSYSAERR